MTSNFSLTINGTKQPIDAILFDLDGTLIDLQEEDLVRHYLKLVAAFFAENGYSSDPREIPAKMLESTDVMLKDTDPETTTIEAFMEHFSKSVGHDSEFLIPLFDRFYVERFDLVKHYTKPIPEIASIVKKCEQLNLKLVVATNPVFPETAVLKRIEWGGLDEVNWSLITSGEIMPVCKPHSLYFERISEMIDVHPSRCLFVGNDAYFDMSAKKVGMWTFLLDTHLLTREEVLEEGPQPDFRGDYLDLKALLSQSAN
ncbi:MAG: HAD family hydrolase [Candidatus Heimdallarchaeota archaeon]|nr:HAD family hydrolase [Candidatus Heimdallarchaeota archaeon]MCK5050017.1 HAD family hydrolase [Candidatus Heimdallarchaeota archaeon]